MVKTVSGGDITPVEVYECAKDWSEEKRDIFLNELTAVMVREMREQTQCTKPYYERCRQCYGYLQNRWMEDFSEPKEQQPASEASSPKSDGADKPAERQIDEKAIGDWFSARFKGAGNGGVNHLPDLTAELKLNRSNKEFAKIALLIHESKYCLLKDISFSKFYISFCVAVGCKQKKYDPCKLQDEEFAKKFYYLQ